VKPSPMPRRRSSLRTGGPPKRKKRMARRAAGLRARSVKPGLRAVIRAAKDSVEARSGGLCEACGMRRARDWHHRKNKSQGGLWSPENGLHVCRPCHRWIGRERLAARARGWAVWRKEDPAEVAVWRRQDAWVWLTPAGGLAEIKDFTGSTDQQCPSVARGLRCALGELHDGDHECGLVFWPVTDEERQAWRITV
jgi:hypothetical protein